MTAERIPDTEWPAVISQGPGYYGLRLPQEYGTIVEYVGPRALREIAGVGPTRDGSGLCTRACSPSGRLRGDVIAPRALANEGSPTCTAGPALGAER